MKNKQSFMVSVDPVVFSIINKELHVLLIKRNSDTFDNFLALPGGLMIEEDQTMQVAIDRVLVNKTGAKVNYVEQLYTRTGHDPRGTTISIAYIALVNEQKVMSNALWKPVSRLPVLAFDHNEVIELALKRLTNKVNYSTLPMYFLPQPLTLPKLQEVYEILLDTKLDKSTFRKKIEETNTLEETGEMIKEGAFRPAKLYKLKDSAILNFNSNIVKTVKI